MGKRQVAVFHLTTIGNTIQASARIAKYIGEQLRVPLYDSMRSIKSIKVPAVLDAAILVNSPTGFADEDWRWFVANRCAKAKRFVFVQNDYKMAPPSQVRRWEERLHKRVSRIMWTTVPDRMEGHDPRSTYVNWNALSWNPTTKIRAWSKRRPGLFYFGALRPHREEALQRYFHENRYYKVTVSAPSRSHEAFKKLLGNVKLYPPFQHLNIALQYFQATVYIEDPWSHEHYCSPASRFYETLSAGTAMLFDLNTAYSLAQAQLNVTPWIVRGPKDVRDLLENVQQIARKQRMLWHRNGRFTVELKQQLTEAWKNLWR